MRSLGRCRVAEVLVVDGQSTDNTIAIASDLGARVLSDEGQGLGYARRLGVLAASQPYILFLDTDVVVVADDTLEVMLEDLVSHGSAGVHAQVLGNAADNYWEWAQDAHFRLTFNHPGPRNAIGCVAALYRRDVLLRYPPDPFFTGASEDGDLSRRLRAGGERLYVSRAAVIHRHRSSFRGFIRQRVWYGRGNGRLAWRHRSPGLLAAPLAFFALATIKAAAANMPGLAPYLFLHALCVSGGGLYEYLRLAGKAHSRAPELERDGDMPLLARRADRIEAKE